MSILEYSTINFIFYKNKTMSKKSYQSISIVLDPEIIQKLEEGKFNKSKLIDSLLEEYFNKEEQNKKRVIPSIPSSECEPMVEGVKKSNKK